MSENARSMKPFAVECTECKRKWTYTTSISADDLYDRMMRCICGGKSKWKAVKENKSLV